MAKAVVYALLATAFFVFFTLSPTPHPDHAPSILGRRHGHKIPAFDPLVTRIERTVEAKGGELTNEIDKDNPVTNLDNISYVPEIADASEYFSDGQRLNITLRLITLFPLLDVSPKDGIVSYEELENWNVEQATDRLSYRTQKEMNSQDINGDGGISFSEAQPQFTQKDIEEYRRGHGEAGWWMTQFNNADIDRSGTLNFDEFNDFLHPEDSNNPRIQQWLLSEKMKRMDEDNDNKLNLVEFIDHVYEIYKAYIAFENNVRVPTAEAKFAELDLNKSKFLEVEELKPMLRYLYPGEMSYAKYYTSWLVHEADDNKNGKLTLEEMLNHESVFYNTLYDDNYDEYDDYHDEL